MEKEIPMALKTILFTLLLSFTLFAQNYTGSGTAGDPYVILTDVGLDSVRYLMSSTGGLYFELGNDIDLSGYANWTPIGNGNPLGLRPFQDNFDGKGHTIKNMNITSVVYDDGYYAGLFREFQTDAYPQHIQNLILDSCRIVSGLGSAVQKHVGILVARVYASSSVHQGHIDTVKVINSYISISNNAPAMGMLIGTAGGSSTYYWNITQCEASNDSLIYGSAGAQPYMGGLIGSLGGSNMVVRECRVKDTYIYHNRAASVAGGFVGDISTSAKIYDSYVYNVEVIDNATTDINFAQTGTFVGSYTSVAINCYAVGTTTYNANLTLKTCWAGYSTQLSATSFADTLVAGTTVSKLSGTVSPSVILQSTDSMKVLSTYEWRGWNTDTVWAKSNIVNQGYPNVEAIFYTGYTLTYPSSTGLAFLQDSTIEITWTTDVPDLTPQGTDTTFVWYALNNDYILIDTVFNNDTSLVWTVPSGIYSTTGRILIANIDSTYEDSSDYFFTVIPLPTSYSNLDIFDVTPPGFSSGHDTVNISVETSNIDSFNVYWSTDSLTWNFIESGIVDTVNGFFQDTTTVSWITPPLIFSKVYIKGTEKRDTTTYYPSDTLVAIGTRNVAGYCFYVSTLLSLSSCAGGGGQISGSEGLLSQKAIYDPSCLWNSNITWRFYLTNLLEDSTANLYYSSSYSACPACERQCLTNSDGSLQCTGGCVFPPTFSYIIKDTTDFGYYSYGTDSTFNSGYSESTGNFIIYKNRKYYLEKDGDNYLIKVTDLLNNITQTYLDYTLFVNSSGLQADNSQHHLATYTRAYKHLLDIADTTVSFGTATFPIIYNGSNTYDEKLSKRLLDSLDGNFGDYNEGYLILGEYGGNRNTYYISLLPEPVYQLNLAEDIWTEKNVISVRDYFRGIDPKILKH